MPGSYETLGGGYGETWLGGSQAKSRVARELDGSADLKTLKRDRHQHTYVSTVIIQMSSSSVIPHNRHLNRTSTRNRTV